VTVAVSDHGIEAVRRDAARRLRERGIERSDLDARLLVGHALGLDHAGLVSAARRSLDQAERASIATLVARRLAGEPVARITGIKEFWGLPLALSPAVLVPRPETETVVEQALAALDQSPGLEPRSRALRIADLGTGSGAIMLALLSELPNAFAVGTDRDPAALAIARHNARRLGLDARARFIACDFGRALAPGFDLVVTNPPYVASDDIATLAPEVRDFDPRGALDGGSDGLAAYRAIAADARRLVAPNAHFIAEFGIGQGDAVAALFAAAGFVDIRIAPDLAGIARTIAAGRNP
jgi:release factor glutamine methyltransferase